MCAERPGSLQDIDEAGYRAANPDAERLGLTAGEHFVRTGQAEGRWQWRNVDVVRQARREKLARLAWRMDPAGAATAGGTMDFLPAETRAAFDIPDTVPVSAHPYGPVYDEMIRDNPDKLFLDLGAGLREVYHRNVVNTDIYPFICTDVLCVGEHLPFADDQFDFIFCFAVLEHTKRPWDVAREMCRVLKPGGRAIVDWPFLQPVHGYPHHYFNATPQGNRSLFEPYCDIVSSSVDWHHHPAIATRWILTAWHNGLQPKQAQAFRALTVGDLIDLPLEDQLAAPWATELPPTLKSAIASGSTVIAEKRPATIPPTAADTPDASALLAENTYLRSILTEAQRSARWHLTHPLHTLRTLRHVLWPRIRP
jgi:SAM-dependent methyltransferase